MKTLADKNIVVGVCGGIAAYKATSVVRQLKEAGAQVRVVPTQAALEFVGRATWEALSGQKVLTSVFEDVDEVAHVRIGQEADAIVVVPATADFIARTRMGSAQDLLSATLLVASCPVYIFPAMHTEMWLNPATQENVQVLRERGFFIFDPDSGRLTGKDSGPGRLSDPVAIAEMVVAGITAPAVFERDLVGKRVLITAGGTREALDPVRFIGNHSSGKQGFALANVALIRGAEVTLIAANVSLPTPPGAERVDVTSAAELLDATLSRAANADVIIMSAAVADFTPSEVANEKIKKQADGAGLTLQLKRTVDVLHTLTSLSYEEIKPVIVGFAAETGDTKQGKDALVLAQEKALRKGADLLVANDVTQGVFGSDRNKVTLLSQEGLVLNRAEGTKTQVAHHIFDSIGGFFSR